MVVKTTMDVSQDVSDFRVNPCDPEWVPVVRTLKDLRRSVEVFEVLENLCV